MGVWLMIRPTGEVLELTRSHVSVPDWFPAHLATVPAGTVRGSSDEDLMHPVTARDEAPREGVKFSKTVAQYLPRRLRRITK
jgi:hypothetical protein